LLANRGGQAAEIAGLVGDRDVDPADMGSASALLARPGDIEPTFRLGGEAFERCPQSMVWIVTPFAGRDDADDAGRRGSAWQQPAKCRAIAGNEAADRYRNPSGAPLLRARASGITLLRSSGGSGKGGRSSLRGQVARPSPTAT